MFYHLLLEDLRFCETSVKSGVKSKLLSFLHRGEKSTSPQRRGISRKEHLLEKESVQRMPNRQKPSLHRGRPRHNHLTGSSSAPVVFLCWSNYHVRLIVLMMTVINQVLLPNLWISSSFQYTRAGHTGW